jgi:hypothetical protein
MQPFFSGTTKPQRQVNLGRGGASTSAASVLETAAQLRRGRDDQRRQEASAQTVQRVWRSSLSRREMKRSWRSEVDEGRTSSGIDAVRKVVYGWEDDKPVSPMWWQAVASGSEYISPRQALYSSELNSEADQRLSVSCRSPERAAPPPLDRRSASLHRPPKDACHQDPHSRLNISTVSPACS